MSDDKKVDGRRNNRPPAAFQFKPGQSANPAGRPRGSRNHRSIVDRQASKLVSVTENNNHRVKRSKFEIMITQQINKAAKGDLKATQFMTDLMFRLGFLRPDEPGAAPKMNASDEAGMADFIRRVRNSEPHSSLTEKANGSEVNDRPQANRPDDGP